MAKKPIKDIHAHHEELIQRVSGQFKDILDSSKQAMYLYLDDTRKVGNKKFSTMLGYRSPEEWANVEESFPEAFVAQKSQSTLVNAYRNAMEKKIGSKLQVTWKKKSGKIVDTEVILVPIAYQNHLFALHFIKIL